MISHQDKCIFVHIPKAAGQSVESIFVERAGLTWEQRSALLLRPNADPKKGPPRLAHLTSEEYVKLGYISEENFKQYFSFSFVRNPWSRLVSEYNYRRKHGDVNYQQDFKTFLFEKFPTPDNDNYLTAKDYYRHVIPQYKFLYKHDECLVDFVGKFENLQQDFNYVCEQLAIDNIILPHKNRTPIKQNLLKRVLSKSRFPSVFIKDKTVNQHYSAYYDDESTAFVAELYKRDIQLFNYTFESE